MSTFSACHIQITTPALLFIFRKVKTITSRGFARTRWELMFRHALLGDRDAVSHSAYCIARVLTALDAIFSTPSVIKNYYLLFSAGNICRRAAKIRCLWGVQKLPL